MFTFRQRAIAFLTACMGVSSSWLVAVYPVSSQGVATSTQHQQVQEVATFLEGVMDTTAQAQTNPKAPSVQMTTCRVTLEPATLQPLNLPPSTILLYQEQALTQKLSQPYRQRLLAIAPGTTPHTVESRSFRLNQPEQLAGLCNQPAPQRTLSAGAIGSPACTVLLTKSPTGYQGETPPQGCPANVRGAVRITNTIELTPTGMNTWDRGFDANGNQVWGARSESYQFRRKQN